MKKSIWRILTVCLAAVMLLSCLTACGGGEEPPADPDKPGAPVEQGTEEELTAVREGLIKATETKGLGDITKMEFYENGIRTTSDKYVQVKDNKKVYYAGDIKRVVNYADGYWLDIPQDWKPDYSMSSLRVRYTAEGVTLVASCETDAAKRYESMEVYLQTMYNVVSNADFQKNNKVSVIEDIKTVTIDEDWTAQVYRVKLDGCAEGTQCYYTYVDYYNKLNTAYHLMFKAVDDRDFKDVYMTFHGFHDKGAPIDTITYPCENNPNWNEETTKFYTDLRAQEHVDWGLFVPKIEAHGYSATIPMMEKRLDYKFPVISQYVHFGHDFPSAFCEKVNADGRMMQISYQYTTNNNGDQTQYSPMLDIYRGTQDEVLKKFAQQVADYGHPLFFRLNNEMNTDWTSYCAIANMLDPDIFVETWIRLYDIFTETGANQYAMWIFNGFDGSYPPCRYMNYRTYMPDAKYIDLIGLTGYNGASPEEQAEGNGAWRTFPEIYDDIFNMYDPLFHEWPWIISEFGCEGKDSSPRPEWITEMFETLAANKYPSLKVAIWFSANDPDPETGGIANKYNLDGDTESLKAFKEGLALTQP